MLRCIMGDNIWFSNHAKMKKHQEVRWQNKSKRGNKASSFRWVFVYWIAGILCNGMKRQLKKFQIRTTNVPIETHHLLVALAKGKKRNNNDDDEHREKKKKKLWSENQNEISECSQGNETKRKSNNMEWDIWRIGRVALAIASTFLLTKTPTDRFIFFNWILLIFLLLSFIPSVSKRMTDSFIPLFFPSTVPSSSIFFFVPTSISFANSLWLLRGFHRSKFVRKLNFNRDVMHIRLVWVCMWVRVCLCAVKTFSSNTCSDERISIENGP